MLKTETYEHNMSSRFNCAICGAYFEERHAAIRLLEDGKPLGDICPTCVLLGPEESAQRMLDRAEYLEQQSGDIRDVAGQLIRIGSEDWATLADLVGSELLAEAHFRDVPDFHCAEWVQDRLAESVKSRERRIRAYELEDETIKAQLEQEAMAKNLDRMRQELARRQGDARWADAKRIELGASIALVEARAAGIDAHKAEADFDAAKRELDKLAMPHYEIPF